MPHENGSLSTNGDNSSLVGGNTNLSDISRMSNTLVIGDSFIVVPDLDSLVLATGDEVLSSLGYGQGVDLSSVRAIEHSDGLSVEAIPVGHLSV